MTTIKELIKWHEKQAEYFSSFGVNNAVTEFHRSAANETKKMLTALQTLYAENVDYVTLNNLGDPHHNQSMKNARDVLSDAKREDDFLEAGRAQTSPIDGECRPGGADRETL